MSIGDEVRHEVQAPSGNRTLGEAANRFVTFQIVMGVIGLIIFLLFAGFIFSLITGAFFFAPPAP
jgi:hypothetical protein